MSFEGKLLAEFEKTQSQIIKIHLVKYMGKNFIDIRLFLKLGNQHTIKGISIPVAKVPDLLIALNEAINKLKKI